MTLIDPDATDLAAPIQYRNLAGAIVTVCDTGTPANASMPDHHYSAECSGCLESLGMHHPYALLSNARKWASGHAATCAAMPRFVSGGQVDRAAWTSLAEEYAKRAVRLLEGKPSTPDKLSTGTRESRDPLQAAQAYANIADVYARLAEH